jgi:hypothetical protein
MTEQTKSSTLSLKKDETVSKAPVSENITGRGVFIVETVPVGVAVRTAFLAEDGRLLESPTVFPDMMYAMAQIDELKQLVAQRFAEAAQVGAQVIAQQIQANQANAAASTTTANPTPAPVETKAETKAAAKDAKASLQ